MKTNDVWKICRSLPASTDKIQWENDRVFKVGGKMFACTGLKPASPWSVKVDGHRFLELTDQPGIKPAPYLARFHWVQVDPEACQLGESTLQAMLENSHALVQQKLSAKKRRELLDSKEKTPHKKSEAKP